MSNGTYADLLKSWGFQSFLWTQFLGAFNDNVYKFIVSMYAIDLAGGDGSKYASIAGVVFVRFCRTLPKTGKFGLTSY
jgi:acyl-[acyl-carrier-protein]-phospholipid O-acyltransferase/long-chain-fatty-acid--[acyl-carrier-protein] ligase